MLNNNWKLEHVGHVVHDLEKSIELYRKLFNFELIHREIIDEVHIEVAFLNTQNSLIELLAPLPGNNIFTKFLEKRGEGLHHICYQVDSVSKELKKLADMGVKLLDQIPKKGSRGFYIAFIHPQSTNGVLTELCGEF